MVPYYEWNTHATQDEHDRYMSGKIESILESIPESIPERTVGLQEPSQQARPSTYEVEKVQKNASVLDILHAKQGKMSLSQAMKRQVVRKNRQ